MQNQLATIRKARGLGAAELAQRVGVSRQTIYAIEAGGYMPNTEVALKLAREMAVQVEDLFHLADAPAEAKPLSTRALGSVRPGSAVRLARVGEQWVSVPVSAAPYYLPEADGVVAKSAVRGRAEANAVTEPGANRLVVAGCDPAMGLLASLVSRDGGVELVPAPASSRTALAWLNEGLVHVAGSHLDDPRTGEFNLPYLRRHFTGDAFAVVTLAQWEEGLVVAKGNPLAVARVEHLANARLRLMNRERGSGARGLLDRLLAQAGMTAKSVGGYDREAQGHLAAAYAVATGEADCCLATECSARAFDLDFVPLKLERFDFVLRREALGLKPVQAFLDALQWASVRRGLEAIAGYDTRATGQMLGS